MEDDDYELGALLGGPVRAIQEAQIAAEREYLSFLLEYGLEEVKRKEGDKTVNALRLRQVEFDMARNISDPSSPGRVVETTAQVRVPLLSLVQMPAVGIEEATIDVTLDVYAQGSEETEKPTRTKSTTASSLLPESRGPALVLKGAISSRSASRTFRTRGKLTVSMKLNSTHDDELHGRLSRIIGEGLSTTVDIPDRPVKPAE